MQITYTKKASKALAKIDAKIAGRIFAKIEAYAADPAARTNNVRPLKGRNGYRLRVGDYRVIFTVTEGGAVAIMTVIHVGHRKEIYDD